jgi:hypothetical protein
MSRLRKLGTVAATFSVAMGIGFIMQNGDALAARFGDAPPPQSPPSATPVVQDTPTPTVEMMIQTEAPAMREQPLPGPVMAAAETAPVPSQPVPAPADVDIALADSITTAPETPAMTAAEVYQALATDAPAALPFSSPETEVAVQLAAVAPETAPAASAAAAAPECPVTLEAQVLSGGLVELSVDAPCAGATPAVFHHGGLQFSAMTQPDGALTVIVPALAVTSVFVADLGNGDGAVATVDVPEVATMTRAVLQWQGAAVMNLHAFTNGAAFGAPGHVWQAAMGQPGGETGFFMPLGDAGLDSPMLAQVYTLPDGVGAAPGVLELLIESEVTADTCGREVRARTLQVTGGSAPVAQEIALILPDCDSIGQFVALPGVLADVTVAAAD